MYLDIDPKHEPLRFQTIEDFAPTLDEAQENAYRLVEWMHGNVHPLVLGCFMRMIRKSMAILDSLRQAGASEEDLRALIDHLLAESEED